MGRRLGRATPRFLASLLSLPRTSAVLFSTRALKSVDLPTLGSPTMPVLSAMLVTEPERNPRTEEEAPGAALPCATEVQPPSRPPPMKALERDRREAPPRATSLEHVVNATLDDIAEGIMQESHPGRGWARHHAKENDRR